MFIRFIQSADYKLVLRYIEHLRNRLSDNIEFINKYESGYLGHSLYHQLAEHDVKCIILVPSTMAIMNTSRVKTDKRDVGNIARCLAFHAYSEVHVPADKNNSIKEYIRMRDNQKIILKKTKQQMLALVLCQGKTYWTSAHVKWLKSLKLGGIFQETLEEYLITYEYFMEKIKLLD